MSIRRNKRIHEFEWEFDAKTSEQEAVIVPVIYHDTEEYGSTITITDGEGEPIISLPSIFFQEVSVEISAENHRRGDTQSIGGFGINMPTIETANDTGLDLPSIERPSVATTTAQVSVMTEEEARDRTDYSKVDQNSIPVVSFTARPIKTAEQVEEESEQLAERGGTPEERLARRKVATNEKASIRKAT